MQVATFQQFLAEVIADELAKNPRPKDVLPVAPVRRGRGRSALPEQADQIAEELVKEALKSGLPLMNPTVDKEKLTGGNTADLVAQLTLHAPFAFKLDNNKKKLAEEGLAMRAIKNNDNLPLRFRNAWPVIYAVRDKVPYAYLMEFFPKQDGWVSLEDRLYPVNQDQPVTLAEATRLMNKVLDILFEGFEGSLNKRITTSLDADYYKRIKERLAETSIKDKRFASIPLTVNDERIEPWEHYLKVMDRNLVYMAKIASPFSTVVHGDPNPGNLMLRSTMAGVELKLIDPKEWVIGDYLFDICKITHFLECTGPVEKPVTGKPTLAGFEFGDAGAVATLSYDEVHVPEWTTVLVNACLEKVRTFAQTHGDEHWTARYELGMAANLLGLPLNRLNKDRNHSALILYGEGLKWLHRFCERLESKKTTPAKPFTSANPSEIEPKPLRDVRDWVHSNLPDVRSATDRRGFQLLQWDPLRQNNAGKPVELSLEHEARLLPATNEALQTLLQALHDSEAREVDEYLLPDNKEFGSLIVSRYKRDVGPQSVDRYYDILPPSDRPTLTERLITVRERIKSSKFMSWSTSNESMLPLNLELPFIALGERGLTARLEFNWVDDLEKCLAEAVSATAGEHVQLRNPLFIAARTQALELDGLTAVLEHTTYREKFGFRRPATNNSAEEEIFVLNVDHITAQDLETGRIGTYTDVDISGVRPIDERELAHVMAFAEALANRYNLRPNVSTKASRDAEVTGLLDQLRGT